MGHYHVVHHKHLDYYKIQKKYVAFPLKLMQTDATVAALMKNWKE